MSTERVKLLVLKNLIWLINVVLFTLFSIITPRGFTTLTNIHFILYTTGFLGFGVIAEAIVLISGNFDLSISENIGFSAMATAVIITSLECSPTLAAVIGFILIIVISTALGAINGLLVGSFGLNPFLATLATYMIFFWGTLSIRTSVVYGLPELFLAPGGSKICGVWMSIPIFFAFVALLHFIFKYARFGSNIYAIGSDVVSSFMLGLNVKKIVFYAYTLAGLFAGLSSLMYVGYLGSVPSMMADGAIFDFFAGAILGGVSIRGGRGTIQGIVGGVIFMGIVRAGLIMLAISPPMIGTITGLLMLTVIVFDVIRDKLVIRIARPVREE